MFVKVFDFIGGFNGKDLIIVKKVEYWPKTNI